MYKTFGSSVHKLKYKSPNLGSKILRDNFVKRATKIDAEEFQRHAQQFLGAPQKQWEVSPQILSSMSPLSSWKMRIKDQMLQDKNNVKETNVHFWDTSVSSLSNFSQEFKEHLVSLLADPTSRQARLLAMHAGVPSIKNLTMLQSHILPQLSRNDAIVESSPCTGKTFAYALHLARRFHNSATVRHQEEASKNYSKVDLTKVPSVRSIVLVKSNRDASKVENILRALLRDTASVQAFTSTSQQENYNRFMSRPFPDTDILVATPEQVLEAITREWIHTNDVSVLVVDDADTVIQSSNNSFETLAQIMRCLPNAQRRQTLVFGEKISDEVVQALRPHLKVLNRDIVLYSGEASVPKKSKFELVETNDKMAQLKQILEQRKGERIAIYAENPEEVAKQIPGALNLGATPEDLSQQLVLERDALRLAKVFVVPETGSPLLNNISTTISLTVTSVSEAVARSTIAKNTILLYSPESDANLSEDASLKTFLDSIKKQAPSFASEKKEDLQRLKDQDAQADIKVIENIISRNTAVKDLYVENYGSSHFVELRKNHPAKVAHPEEWEWRVQENAVRYFEKVEVEQMQQSVDKAKEINEARRVYKKEKREKNRQIYLEKKRKRKERKEEEEEDEEE